MDHNSVITLDFDAIAHNLGVVRSMVGPACAVNAVVKADAYGLGVGRVARRLVQAGASMLTVFSPDQAEGLEGLPVPVLVLQPVRAVEPGGVLHSMIVAGRLHLVLHDLHHLAELILLAREMGVTLPVHIELDTGIHRGGCAAEDAGRLLLGVAASRDLRLAGVMSHLSHAKTSSERCRDQVREFEHFVDCHRALIPPECVLHMASTYGALRSAVFHQTMVRVGLAWTGLALDGPDGAERVAGISRFRPALRWTSGLIHTRRVPRGQGVGYGWQWVARRDALIGLVPVGYADGYPTLPPGVAGAADQERPSRWVRVTSRRSGVERSAFAPVVGAVNMDQIAVDLTGLESVVGATAADALGCEVELYGTEPGAPNFPAVLAERVGVRVYELLCRLNPRIPRVAEGQQALAARLEQGPARPVAVRAAPECS
jgi:alanine racemase